ncbi:hypothetical protein GCM10022631_31490 [Deinococcus rubellus]
MGGRTGLGTGGTLIGGGPTGIGMVGSVGSGVPGTNTGGSSGPIKGGAAVGGVSGGRTGPINGAATGVVAAVTVTWRPGGSRIGAGDSARVGWPGIGTG